EFRFTKSSTTDSSRGIRTISTSFCSSQKRAFISATKRFSAIAAKLGLGSPKVSVSKGYGHKKLPSITDFRVTIRISLISATDYKTPKELLSTFDNSFCAVDCMFTEDRKVRFCFGKDDGDFTPAKDVFDGNGHLRNPNVKTGGRIQKYFGAGTRLLMHHTLCKLSIQRQW
ncbi:hypothetical protein SARC_14008, partial [Sphaeroforma arctica JP610]